MTLEARVREVYSNGGFDLPLPAAGATALRHRKLAEFGRLDLSVARLAEAHLDAHAILSEASCQPKPGLYGVWAAETAHLPCRLNPGSTLAGTKMFCTGAGLIDRALIAVEGRLLDIDLRQAPDLISIDLTAWKTAAFVETQTATVMFSHLPVAQDDIIGEDDWYLHRPGFWHGALGPAACWAGGAMALVDYANSQTRDDTNTMSHLAAMNSNVWAMQSYLDRAGDEIDRQPADNTAAQIRALTVRHLIDQACSDICQRLGRAYGPRPLAFHAEISKRVQELQLYTRQCHAERDLESLGRLLHPSLTD